MNDTHIRRFNFDPEFVVPPIVTVKVTHETVVDLILYSFSWISKLRSGSYVGSGNPPWERYENLKNVFRGLLTTYRWTATRERISSASRYSYTTDDDDTTDENNTMVRKHGRSRKVM